MKILLYVVFAIVGLLVAFFAWFFFSFAKVPGLVVPPNATEAERMAVIDDYLDGLRRAGKFNGAVLVARQGEVLLMNTYGFTDHTLKTELGNQSAFRLASVSKQFTAAGYEAQNNFGVAGQFVQHSFQRHCRAGSRGVVATYRGRQFRPTFSRLRRTSSTPARSGWLSRKVPAMENPRRGVRS